MRIRRVLLALVLSVAFVGASAGVAAAERGKGRDRCVGAVTRVTKLQKEQQRLEARLQAVGDSAGVRAQKLEHRAQRIGVAVASLQARCKA